MDYAEIGKQILNYVGQGVALATVALLFAFLRLWLAKVKSDKLRQAALAIVIEVEKQSAGVWNGATKKAEAIARLQAMGLGWSQKWLDQAVDIAVAEINDHLSKIAAKALPPEGV